MNFFLISLSRKPLIKYFSIKYLGWYFFLVAKSTPQTIKIFHSVLFSAKIDFGINTGDEEFRKSFAEAFEIQLLFCKPLSVVYIVMCSNFCKQGLDVESIKQWLHKRLWKIWHSLELKLYVQKYCESLQFLWAGLEGKSCGK